MIKEFTKIGFGIYQFKDRYNSRCSLEKSSIATEDCIWLGVDDAEPKIMAEDTKEGGNGWVKFNIPPEVLLNTRMHLTRKNIFILLPILIKFVLTGRI